MHRFFITNNQDNPTEQIILTDDCFYQISRALRITPNEDIEIVYGGLKIIGNFDGEKVIVKAYDKIKPKKGPKTILVQGIPKNQKISMILQKVTELDVDEILLWDSKRSVIKAFEFESREERYNKIIREAAEQTGRDELPIIKYISNLNEVGPGSFDLVLVLYEDEEKHYIRDYLTNLNQYENIYIIIGPEGGITKDEIEFSESKGWNIVSIGKNILRTDTAIFFALSSIMLNKN